MVSGQGSSSEQSSKPPRTTFLNPAAGVLANLFGIPTQQYQGGLSYGGGQLPFAGSIFGQGAGFENIGDYLQTENPYAAYFMTPEARAITGQGISDFGEYVLPSYQEMVTTGAPTNVEPLVQKAVSDVAETLGPSTGLYSSDLNKEALRQAAQLRVGAEESAAARRNDALAMSSLVLGGPASVAEQLLGLGEGINLTATEAGRAITLLQLMAGLQPTGAISRGNISSGSSKSGGGGISGQGMSAMMA